MADARKIGASTEEGTLEKSDPSEKLLLPTQSSKIWRWSAFKRPPPPPPEEGQGTDDVDGDDQKIRDSIPPEPEDQKNQGTEEEEKVELKNEAEVERSTPLAEKGGKSSSHHAQGKKEKSKKKKKKSAKACASLSQAQEGNEKEELKNKTQLRVQQLEEEEKGPNSESEEGEEEETDDDEEGEVEAEEKEGVRGLVRRQTMSSDSSLSPIFSHSSLSSTSSQPQENEKEGEKTRKDHRSVWTKSTRPLQGSARRDLLSARLPTPLQDEIRNRVVTSSSSENNPEEGKKEEEKKGVHISEKVDEMERKRAKEKKEAKAIARLTLSDEQYRQIRGMSLINEKNISHGQPSSSVRKQKSGNSLYRSLGDSNESQDGESGMPRKKGGGGAYVPEAKKVSIISFGFVKRSDALVNILASEIASESTVMQEKKESLAKIYDLFAEKLEMERKYLAQEELFRKELCALSTLGILDTESNEQIDKSVNSLACLHALDKESMDKLNHSFSAPLATLLNGEMALANVERLKFQSLQQELVECEQRLERLETKGGKEVECLQEKNRRLRIKDLLQQESAHAMEHLKYINQYTDLRTVKSVQSLLRVKREHYRRGLEKIEAILPVLERGEKMMAEREAKFIEETKNMPVTVRHQGLLWRKAGRRQWKQRWFVLHQNKLYYFGTEGNLRGVISLVDAVCRPCSSHRKYACFEITTRQGGKGKQKFVAGAETDASRTHWIQEINLAIISKATHDQLHLSVTQAGDAEPVSPRGPAPSTFKTPVSDTGDASLPLAEESTGETKQEKETSNDDAASQKETSMDSDASATASKSAVIQPEFRKAENDRIFLKSSSTGETGKDTKVVLPEGKSLKVDHPNSNEDVLSKTKTEEGYEKAESIKETEEKKPERRVASPLRAISPRKKRSGKNSDSSNRRGGTIKMKEAPTERSLLITPPVKTIRVRVKQLKFEGLEIDVAEKEGVYFSVWQGKVETSAPSVPVKREAGVLMASWADHLDVKRTSNDVIRFTLHRKKDAENFIAERSVPLNVLVLENGPCSGDLRLMAPSKKDRAGVQVVAHLVLDLQYLDAHGDVIGDTPRSNVSMDLTENDRAVVRKGWLRKKGAIKRAWKRRHFVLDTRKISYYKKEGGKTPQGTVQLKDVCQVEIDTLHDHAFCIHIPGRIYFVAASDDKDRDIWVESIQCTVQLIQDAASSSERKAEPLKKDVKDETIPSSSAAEANLSENPKDEKVKVEDVKEDTKDDSNNSSS